MLADGSSEAGILPGVPISLDGVGGTAKSWGARMGIARDARRGVETDGAVEELGPPPSAVSRFGAAHMVCKGSTPCQHHLYI